jgi:integrase/recombinase XerD
MTARDRTPTPVLITLTPAAAAMPSAGADGRLGRIDEFFQARSLAPNTEKAYRHDLSYWLNWTDRDWAAIDSRQMAQFKRDLGAQTTRGQSPRSDASVRRILGTLQTFYAWLQQSGYVADNPTMAIALPKLPPSELSILTVPQVAKIRQAAAALKFPERNMALVSLLSHGLRVSEITPLNQADFQADRIQIRHANAAMQGDVPLSLDAQMWLQHYCQARVNAGETLQADSPLLLSHSPRNAGARISYNAIRQLIDTIACQVGFKFTAHQFRHTFAAELRSSGMNADDIRTSMRQRSVQVRC